MKHNSKIYSFGERLSSIRRERNMTIEELASRMKTNTGQIWRLEKGRSNPRLETIQRICRVLDVRIQELVPSEKEYSDKDREFVENYKALGKANREKLQKMLALIV